MRSWQTHVLVNLPHSNLLIRGARRGGEEAVAGRYAREWQTHVLANLPFYELLMPRFLALTRERVSSQGDSALADVLKVLSILNCFQPCLEC